MIISASSPGTGAVCYKESEESANGKAFYNIPGRYAFHQPAFSKIEEGKSNSCTYEDSYYSCLKPGGTYDSFNPVPVRF